MNDSMSETYISVDVEADGPIPGPHSMLQLGAVAFNSHATELDCFEVNVDELEGAAPDLTTKEEFWDKFPDAYAATRKNTKPPQDAIANFERWVQTFQSPVFVGYPASFDFTYVRWYMERFLGSCIFGTTAIDVKTMAWTLGRHAFRHTTRSRFPDAWLEGVRDPLTHSAVEDARHQGRMFFNILRDTGRHV